MRIAWFDARSGISGDMTLGALLDAGASLDVVRAAVAAVAGHVVTIETRPHVHAGGPVRGLRVSVGQDDHEHHRTAGQILAAIASSGLPEPVIRRASAVFERLAIAEGAVHGEPPEHVHFHEVGAIDSIADIVGVAAALHDLRIDRVEASALPWTHGVVVCRHGVLPVPAPATVELLKGWPVFGADVEGEFVTPTGAAFCAALAAASGPAPALVIERVGCGFGTRDWPDGRPNCLRVLVGDAAGQGGAEGDDAEELAANIDDTTPDQVARLAEALLEAGALDAWIEPILMKKGRPAWTVRAIAARDRREAVVSVFFDESPTIGVRMHRVERAKLVREEGTAGTSLGAVRVKRVFRDGRLVRTTVEADDLRRVAREHGLAVMHVRERLASELG